MNEFNLKVHLRGVRGSISSPIHPTVIDQKIVDTVKAYESAASEGAEIEDFVNGLHRSARGGYGGCTACTEIVSKNGSRVIIDAGSGLKNVATSLMSTDLGKGCGEAHIFLTHFHWDHLVGLPFFIPIFIPGNKIHIYAVQDTVNTFLDHLFCKPFFPLEKKDLGAEIILHQLEPRKSYEVDDIKLTPYQLDHPDPCWGYRVEAYGSSYAHCVDTECTRMSKAELGEDLPLYEEADLLLFDAQYSLQEVTNRINWGHSASSIGMDIAVREKVKRIIFVHHDPYAPDTALKDQEKKCLKYYKLLKKQADRHGESFHELEWEYGHEGLEIELG